MLCLNLPFPNGAANGTEPSAKGLARTSPCHIVNQLIYHNSMELKLFTELELFTRQSLLHAGMLEDVAIGKHVWQSRERPKDFSLAYFKHITAYKALYR